MIYQMMIESKDPDRYLPPSWNFQPDPKKTAWETALYIAERENVKVLRVVNEKGLEVPRDT